MKVLLINPISNIKSHVLPLGLASIASYLEERKIEVAVIDAWALGLTYEALGQQISAIAPDIIGITIMSPRFNQAKLTAQAARKAAPKSVIVLGGPHPSAMPKETLEEIAVADICVIGEGEITFSEIVNVLQSKGNLGKVNGIAFRDNESNIKITESEKFIENLDTLPYPARHLFPVEKYKTHPPYGRKNPYMSMITSRGCPYRCAYCSKEVFGDRLRMQSPERVVDEMEYLVNKYGAKEIHFYDDDFTMNMKRVEEICDEILNRKIKILWSCTTRVDLVSKELLIQMKKAGCWLISYGVESGNQDILNTIQKGIKIETVQETFKITRQAGIKTLGFFMVGLPGETENTIEESIAFSLKLNPDFVGWGVLKVFPGSPFYRMVEEGKFGGFERLKNISDNEFAYHLIFEDNLSFAQLEKAVQKANKAFYLRPGYMFKRLCDINSFGVLIHYIRGGVDVVKSILEK